jgi:hypothetical protein
MKKLQVLVVFEFGGIDDPNSEAADIAVDEVTEVVSGIMNTEWQTPAESVSGWVQEVLVTEEGEA